MKKKDLKIELSRAMDVINTQTERNKSLTRRVEALHEAKEYLREDNKLKQEVINDLQKIIHSNEIPLPSIVQGGPKSSVPLLLNKKDYWEETYAIYCSQMNMIEAVDLTITDMLNHFNNYIAWMESKRLSGWR